MNNAENIWFQTSACNEVFHTKTEISGKTVVGSAALSCYIVLQYVQTIVRLHSECYLEIVRNNVYFKLITFG